MEDYKKSLEELPDTALLTLFAITKMAMEAGTYPEVKANAKDISNYINTGFSRFISKEDMIEQIIAAQS